MNENVIFTKEEYENLKKQADDGNMIAKLILANPDNVIKSNEELVCEEIDDEVEDE